MNPQLERSDRGSNKNSAAAKSKFLWPAFIAVMLVAGFFRFYRLADHPLGIFYDPAFNGLDAVRLIQRGGPVIFFPSNGGREPLFIYLLIPFIRLFGTIPFSTRLPAAIAGLLNVALLFGFLYNLGWPTGSPPIQNSSSSAFRSHSKLSLWFATLAGLTLAVSYWHITVSRPGLRIILASTLSVPIFWFFLKGWTTNQKRWFLLSGLGMGLAGYSYSAARLLPVILILAWLPEFFRRPWPYIKARLLNLLLFGLAALLIYLPMAWYLLTHPAQFAARAFSVMVWNFLDTPAEIIAELGRNTLRVAGFFCCAGSPNPIFGLPGYPGLPALLTPFLLLGLVTAAKNWPNLFQRLLLLWWLIGLAPSIIAIEAPHPLRMALAMVPTAILVAHGLLIAAAWLQARLRPPVSHPAWSLWLAIILILAPVPGMFRAYFVHWTDLQATRGIYDYGAVAIRNEILSRADEDIPIYLPLSRFNDSTLLFYLSGPFERRAALSVPPAGRALVIAPDQDEPDTTWVHLQNHTATLLPPLIPAGRQILQTALANPEAEPVITAAGEMAAWLAPLSTDPAGFTRQPTQSISASFGPVRLTGADYPKTLAPPADSLPVTLYWQANRTMKDEYDILLQLVDDQRQVWGSNDAQPTAWVYPTSFWRPGQDQIAAAYRVLPDRPEPPPPGRYWLALSVIDPATRHRLPLTEGAGDSPDTFFLGPLKLPLPPSSPLPPPATGTATFGELALLSGVEIDRSTLAAGEPLRFTLQWEALSTADRDYTVFVHLLDSEGNLVAGQDTQPVAGRYPTTIWSPGEQILDSHTLPIPDTLKPGRYQLAIGLYHHPSGERLSVHLSDGRTNLSGSLALPPIITVTKNR